MYAPDPYRVDDQDRLFALIDAFPFAALARSGPAGPVIAHLPLALDRDGVGAPALVGHLARANPFLEGAAGQEVVALFSGPDGYISPSTYPSKAIHGKAVPTWNYVRVEARGRLCLETDPARLLPYVEAPTAMMERRREAPWSVKDAPAAYVEALCAAIVGVRIALSACVGAWKLDQRKSPADRQGAIEGLRSQGQDVLARLMETHAPDPGR